ncbi:hypothetical protein CHLNCDRAFT_52243 [Chlorella variabilis]|uniref:Retrotransposon gag domain-containing protein n=1 Tax=Chlorella variabilis TaxID=554065 RepID=E1ZF67_CHLVA|nr:hypothetical protein CHLNCDRAFT_52243 [Chlorella variabilis]EFN55617.1 hypothetical protein CHLNCDRAFT_52243 [Chlorella variabilis]|eukprot:XP_005847719.1 hypothetical protein CHLNCDRAFT_52243 [Chlorella variabilis]
MQVAVSKFSGSAKENPETFIRTVESAKGLYSWSDAQAMAFAGLHLKGKALDWYNIQEPMTWLRFKKALIGRFGLEPSRMLAALTKRMQGEKESVRDYADALCTLVRHSQDPNLQSTLRHFFMSGLREDVQSFVKTRRPETFEAAVAEGEYFEDTSLQQGVNGAHPIRSCQYDFEEDLRHAIHILVRGSSYLHIDTDLSK